MGRCLALRHATIAVLMLAATVCAQDETLHTIGPIPAWVRPLAVPPADVAPPEDSAGGRAFLLSERQVNRVLETPEVFVHRAWLVHDGTGVQGGSEFSVAVDPTFQTVILHRLRVHRDGVVSDRLDPDALQVIRREAERDYQLYDGARTVFQILEDVRPGDIIESAYTLRGVNPVMDGHFSDRVSLQWSVPLYRGAYRLLWPADRPLAVRPHGTTATPRITRTGDVVEYLWVTDDTPPIVDDPDVPLWYSAYAWVQLSDFETWADLGQWALDLYTMDEPLAPLVAEKVDAIRAGGGTTEEQILAAIRFVQDDVRYLAITLGTGTYRPSPPSAVMERRFGDCKDKSSLLVAILRGLGVQADVAWVNTWFCHTIEDWHASPSAFDHVIVRLVHDGRTIWVDPTDAFARGRLAALALPAYGRAFVVSGASTTLTPVLPNPEAASGREIVASFMAANVGAPAGLEVETTYRGAEADIVRAMLARTTLAEYANDCRDYYAVIYPSLRSRGPVEVDDDEVGNRLRTVETYTIPEFWTRDESLAAFVSEFYPLEIDGVLDSPRSPDRTMPLAVTHPTNIRYTMKVRLSDEWSFEPDLVEVKNDALSYRFEVVPALPDLTIEYELQTHADHVAPADVAAYIDDIIAIRETLTYGLSYPDFSAVNLLPLVMGFGLGTISMIVVALVSLVALLLLRNAHHDVPIAIAAAATIWTAPRLTMRRVYDGGSAVAMSLLLVMVAGIWQVWDNASLRALGDTVSLPALLAIGLVLGPILGLLQLYIGGWLLTRIGRGLGGTGDGTRVRAALGFSSWIPALIGVVWIPGLLMLREELFTSTTPRMDASTWLQSFVGVTSAIGIIGGIWSLVALVKCLAEAHRFSAWRGLGAVLLLGVILLFLLVVFIGVIAVTASVAM